MARGSLNAPPPPSVRAHFLNIQQLANGSVTAATTHSPLENHPLATSDNNTTTSTCPSSRPSAHDHSFQPDPNLNGHITPLRLTPREESTRVQLQRQNLRDQRARALVSKTIPGFKTSAAFLASLRTNLRLHASPPASPISTPNSMSASAGSLPPPSPFPVPIDSAMADPQPAVPDDPLAGVPELHSYLAVDDEEMMDALNLVADSVAQQRQAANSVLIFHPLNLAILVGVMAIVSRTMLEFRYDWTLAAVTCAGLVMVSFALYRFFTQGYLSAAEKINYAWLNDADVLVTKFGSEIIGTCMIDWVSSNESRQKRKKAWRGQIKGWTVKLRYRGKGVGSALLEDAVREAKKRGADGLVFADDHANSTRVLPDLYNATFDRRDRKYRELLQDLVETSPARSKKK